MAIDKGLGYEDTVVNGLELHEWSRLTGRTMLAPSVSGGQVTVVPSATRTVRVSAGPIFGHAIRDELVQEDIGPLPEVQSGSQYFMLVRAAEWGTTNNSSIKVVPGTASRAIPPFQQEPGTRADTPLALVRITKDQPLPTEIVDLRLIAEEPGIYTIFDDLALQLADRPGVQCYNANTKTIWSRVYNDKQQRVWIPSRPESLTGPRPMMQIGREEQFGTDLPSVTVGFYASQFTRKHGDADAHFAAAEGGRNYQQAKDGDVAMITVKTSGVYAIGARYYLQSSATFRASLMLNVPRLGYPRNAPVVTHTASPVAGIAAAEISATDELWMPAGAQLSPAFSTAGTTRLKHWYAWATRVGD
jgi:hypothetical protein